MYCHQQDWAAALSVANTCDPASVPGICTLQVVVLYTSLAERKQMSMSNKGPLPRNTPEG